MILENSCLIRVGNIVENRANIFLDYYIIDFSYVM